MILHSKKPSARRVHRPRLFPMRPDPSPHYRRRRQTVATHSEPLFRVDLLTFISLPISLLLLILQHDATTADPNHQIPCITLQTSKGLIRPSETFGSNFD